MIINVTWICPKCGSKELSGFQSQPEPIEEVHSTIYFVNCSECEEEFRATVCNAKIEIEMEGCD